MSAADEIKTRMDDIEARMAPAHAALREALRAMYDRLIVMTFGREVCARRARELRRRGNQVHFTRRSGTGKKRFRWMPPLPRFNFTEDTTHARR